jgi:hypothetical protein
MNKKLGLTNKTLVDLKAELNCILERLLPFKYLTKTTQFLIVANKQTSLIQHKLLFVKIKSIS